MDTPNVTPRPVDPSQSPSPRRAWWQDPLKLSLVIAVGVLAVVVTVLMLAFVNGGGEGAVASATPSPSSSIASSPSSSAEPTSSVDESSSEAPSPTSSASAAASDPPQAELAEGWARTNTGLNLRNSAGSEYPIVTKLPAGEVVWISSGPYREADADDQFDWYSVQTLNDKYGWIASGSPDDPHATNISNQFRFRSCGPVGLAGNSGLVNGLRTGRLAEVDRATFELGKAMGTDGCLIFSNEDYEPTVRLEVDVHACGAPSWDGSVARLQTTSAGSVDASWRVPSTLAIPGLLLTDDQRVDTDGLTNHQKLFVLGSRLSSPFACVTADLVRGKAKRQTVSTEIAACMPITAKDSQAATFDPAHGDPVTLIRSNRDGLNAAALNDPAIFRLTAGSRLRTEILGDC